MFAKLGLRGYQPYERLGLWLRRELRPLVEGLLLSPECLDRGVLTPDAVRGRRAPTPGGRAESHVSDHGHDDSRNGFPAVVAAGRRGARDLRCLKSCHNRGGRSTN